MVGTAQPDLIVVTGATSRTGAVVARRLLTGGARVRAVGRSAERLQSLADLGAEPYIGEPTDSEAMRGAFAGAAAAWVMLQPNYLPEHHDFRGFQEAIIGAVVPAIEAAGVGHVVTLSGTEAELPAGTGPVLGLRSLEQRLDAVPGLAVLHLRSGYYMENLLGLTGQLEQGDVLSGPIRGDRPLPFVATSDIAELGASALLARDFAGSVVQEVHGERDLTLTEATSVIGRVLDRPRLRYVQRDLGEQQAEWRSSGMSAHAVGLMTEVAEGINARGYHRSQPRSARTTTPTALEQFVADQMQPASSPRRTRDR